MNFEHNQRQIYHIGNQVAKPNPSNDFGSFVNQETHQNMNHYQIPARPSLPRPQRDTSMTDCQNRNRVASGHNRGVSGQNRAPMKQPIA